jgi:outer membrane immunogenic protein
MNAVLTYAADTPLTRRTCATKGISAAAIAVLSAMAFAVASGALAADVPLGPGRPPPPPPVAAPGYPPTPFYYYNWTGFYIGGNVGGAWDRTTFADTFDSLLGVNFNNTRSGFIAGGQFGYNWQISSVFVLGVEWMFDGTGISSDIDTVVVDGIALSATSKVDWIQTLAARFGWASNNWLFYGKAGAGWVHDSATLTVATPFNIFSADASDTNRGWMFGAGIEYGFTPNWSARIEWDHIGLGDVTHPGFVTLLPFDTITVSRQLDLLTVGLNYKFSGW